MTEITQLFQYNTLGALMAGLYEGTMTIGELLKHGDLGIGIMMSFGMAIGIIFSFMTPGYQADMSTYLFGNILLSNCFGR